MKCSKDRLRLLALLLVLVLLLTGCSSETDGPGNGAADEIVLNDNESKIDDDILEEDSTTNHIIVKTPDAPKPAVNRPSRPVTTTVALSDNNIQISGNGARAEGSILTITADGVYELSGALADGQIIIDAPDAAVVELVLSGVDITSDTNAAIYCKNAKELRITLDDGTRNTLSDTENFTYVDAAEEEPNATLFSKPNLNIGGGGSLTVNASFNHGINTKDALVIEGGSFTVNAAADGIRGRDSLVVLDGTFNITAGIDGFQSSNIDAADVGWVVLAGGSYTINACGDAIQAETALTISNGDFNIVTDGTPAGESDSQKGLKAGTLLIVENGTFRINSRDDAIHSNVDVQIDGGTFHIETNDDGIHADRNLYINDGEIDIPTCYEGFEGTVIEVNGGKTFIDASNDAISAAAGTPEAEKFTGRGGNPNVQAWFNGGEVEAVSGGDVVDSNGNIYVTGGTLRLSAPPYPDYEGSLLCNGDVTISGGNLAAVGCMGVNVYWEAQPVLWFSHVDEIPEGTVLSIKDESGNVLLELTTRNDAVQSAYTSPEFKAGEIYALYMDGVKKIEITLESGMNAIGDDGGKFTGGYSRGNMASFN